MLSTPLWVSLHCGGCRKPFTGNAKCVPQYNEKPACPQCWEKINGLRVQMGLQPWDLPKDAYPEG
jgi:hypothetical protein